MLNIVDCRQEGHLICIEYCYYNSQGFTSGGPRNLEELQKNWQTKQIEIVVVVLTNNLLHMFICQRISLLIRCKVYTTSYKRSAYKHMSHVDDCMLCYYNHIYDRHFHCNKTMSSRLHHQHNNELSLIHI